MNTLVADAVAYVRDRADGDLAAARIMGRPVPDAAERVAAILPGLIEHLRYLWGGDPRGAIRADDMIAAYAARIAEG